MTELGHFEARLVGELKQLVPVGPAPAQRRRWPRAAVLAALASLAAAGAGAAALTHALRADPHKAGLARTLAAGSHVGPRVAASGPITLSASAGGRDVEIDYGESPRNGWSAVTRPPCADRRPRAEPRAAEHGLRPHRDRARRDRRAAVRRRAGRAGPLGKRGFFLSAVPRDEDAARATLVVRDAAGGTIARRPLSR